MRLEGQIAFVTGGSRGLGPAICEDLAAEGAHVIVGYRRAERDAAAVVERIRSAGGRAEAVAIDVRDAASVNEGVRGIVSAHERLDVLVTSAGVHHDAYLATMPDEAWDEVLRTNLDGTMRCARAGLRAMIKQRSGSIVAVASVAGLRASAGQTNYAASKGAILAFVRSLAAEVAHQGVRVNAVVPGMFSVGMATRTPAARADAVLGLVPMKRRGDPRELARAVTFLASSDASYVTGQGLVVDGGLSA